MKNRLVDCLFIAESKLNDSHQSNVFKVDGYTLYRKDNPRDGGGGLLCYIRSDIPSYSVTPQSGPIETLQINCVFQKQKWSILGTYKKPSVSQSSINEDLDKVIDKSLNKCDKFIVLGDLNCNMLKSSNNAVTRLCQDYNLTNIISKPTCFKADPPTLIDVMLVSNKKVCKSSMVTPCPLSDFHHFITGVLDIDLPRTTTKRIHYRSYKHFDPIQFGNDLRQAPFHTGEVLDLDTHMWFFQQLFLSILDRHAPIKTKVIRTNIVPHMTKAWKSAIYKRNQAYNTYKQYRTDKNWDIYRKLRNECTRQSRIALRDYFTEKCTTENGPSKEFWSTIKPYFSKKGKQNETIQLDVDGQILSDPLEVAEAFNTYFTNVAKDIGKDSPYLDNTENHPSLATIDNHVHDIGLDTFTFRATTEKDILDTIK